MYELFIYFKFNYKTMLYLKKKRKKKLSEKEIVKILLIMVNISSVIRITFVMDILIIVNI